MPAEFVHVEAELDQLILYETGGHYKRTLEHEKKLGIQFFQLIPKRDTYYITDLVFHLKAHSVRLSFKCR